MDVKLYQCHDIPNQFVLPRNNKWKYRQQSVKIIGRMCSVSPKDIKRYYLGPLLLHISGAFSYGDLKVTSKICSIFAEAPKKRSLLCDGIERERYLIEAALFSYIRNYDHSLV